MLKILLTVIHVLVSLVLIAVVLLQTGKRADLAGAFGGGGSQTAFGTRGAATLLSKLTTITAVVFMLTSLGLALVTVGDGGRRGTVLDRVPVSESAPAPVAPDGAAPTSPDAPAKQP